MSFPTTHPHNLGLCEVQRIPTERQSQKGATERSISHPSILARKCAIQFLDSVWQVENLHRGNGVKQQISCGVCKQRFGALAKWVIETEAPQVSEDVAEVGRNLS